MTTPFTLPAAAATRRSSTTRLLLAALLAALLMVGYGSGGRAQAATIIPTTTSSTTISVTSALSTIQAAVKAVGSAGTVNLVNPGTLTVNNKQVCDWVVVISLYALGGFALAYLAGAGVLVTVAGVAITGAQLSALAGSLISWGSVYSYVDTNICK